MIEYLAQKMGVPGEIMNTRKKEIIKQLSQTAIQAIREQMIGLASK